MTSTSTRHVLLFCCASNSPSILAKLSGCRAVYLVHIGSSSPHQSLLWQHPVLQDLMGLPGGHLTALQPLFAHGEQTTERRGQI